MSSRGNSRQASTDVRLVGSEEPSRIATFHEAVATIEANCERVRGNLDELDRTLESMGASLRKIEKGSGPEVLLKVNIGGKLFEVPSRTLLRDSRSLFAQVFCNSHRITHVGGSGCAAIITGEKRARGVGSGVSNAADDDSVTCAASAEDDQLVSTQENNAQLLRDENGVVFFDRDPHTFALLLSVLRDTKGHVVLTPEEADMVVDDAMYYQLYDHTRFSSAFVHSAAHGLEGFFAYARHWAAAPKMDEFASIGTNINPQRTRFRSVYSVCPVGDGFFTAGCHSCTFTVKACEYVGIGVISDECTNFDSEYHRCRNCCVYYMTGVLYSNYPNHEKLDTFRKYDVGAVIKVTINMDKNIIEFSLNDMVQCVPCPTAIRLRFAVTMKNTSEVHITGGGCPGTGFSMLHSNVYVPRNL